jgi:hypothetical protein
MEIVIQGGLWSNTIDAAQSYLTVPFVERVIISTWTDQEVPHIFGPRITVIRSEKPVVSSGNMNWQIVSSREGIKQTNPADGIVAKTRSDQKISTESLRKLYDYFLEYSKGECLKYDDKTGPKAQIFSIGLNRIFPFHPCDHIFWGYKPDMEKLFALPLMAGPIVSKSTDWNTNIRQPIYIGSHYYAHFDPRVYHYLENFLQYLTDNAPRRAEAMELYHKLREQVFKPFPRIDLYWIKFNSSYWYDEYGKQGEYYAD